MTTTNSRAGTRFLSAQTCQEHLGVTREELDVKVASRLVLQMTTSDGVTVYPEAQFTATGELLPGLADILSMLLRATFDEWTVFYWLTAPLDDFGGCTALDVLRLGNRSELDLIRAFAYDDASAWESTR
ncbi:hypothetical protein [Microbacterium sp. 77mftsu3.1]|uniref:hypothetical protein n=1 Tax=Microbacterium sp. 77mftsu3.1 TaxID=1761802 RepID=UPI00037DCAD5|nr:hypothetical protein [Microbacterium sp. 77mftsu3.1]